MELIPLHDTAAVRVCQSKAMYETRKVAETVAYRRMLLSGTPLYVYECGVCCGWHLTKQERETSYAVSPVAKADNDIPSGARFGLFTVVKKVATRPAKYECRCRCGAIEVRRATAIRNPRNHHDCCAKCGLELVEENKKAIARIGMSVHSATLFYVAFGMAVLTGRVCNDKPVLRLK